MCRESERETLCVSVTTITAGAIDVHEGSTHRIVQFFLRVEEGYGGVQHGADALLFVVRWHNYTKSDRRGRRRLDALELFKGAVSLLDRRCEHPRRTPDHEEYKDEEEGLHEIDGDAKFLLSVSKIFINKTPTPIWG